MKNLVVIVCVVLLIGFGCNKKPSKVEQAKGEGTKSTKAGEGTKPVEPTKPVDVTKPVEPTKPVDVTKPVEPTKPVDVVKPVKPTKPVDAAKPDPTKSVESKKNMEIQLKELGKVLDQYKLDNAKYPNQDLGLKALLQNRKGMNEPYLKQIPKDQWGKEYVYKSVNTSYMIISYGADGKKGGTGENVDLQWAYSKVRGWWIEECKQ